MKQIKIFGILAIVLLFTLSSGLYAGGRTGKNQGGPGQGKSVGNQGKGGSKSAQQSNPNQDCELITEADISCTRTGQAQYEICSDGKKSNRNCI